MRPPGKKKAVQKKVIKKTARKTAVRAAPARAQQSPTGKTLAARILNAPRLVDPKLARAHVAQWLAGLSTAEAKPLKALLVNHPTIDALLESLAESSPYLWELASSDPLRLFRLLAADPNRHHTELLAEYGRAIAACEDE